MRFHEAADCYPLSWGVDDEDIVFQKSKPCNFWVLALNGLPRTVFHQCAYEVHSGSNAPRRVGGKPTLAPYVGIVTTGEDALSPTSYALLLRLPAKSCASSGVESSPSAGDAKRTSVMTLSGSLPWPPSSPSPSPLPCCSGLDGVRGMVRSIDRWTTRECVKSKSWAAVRGSPVDNE
jgi:hypothetical protein